MKLGHGWLTVFVLCFLLLNTLAHGEGLCHRDRNELLDSFELATHRLAFKNHGGLFNGGVCWWHSRLQRSSIYLTNYSPALPKPTLSEAKLLIRHLVAFDSVITIPGYSNFNDFSHDFENLIQTELNDWQLRDGLLYQQWVRGLYGRPKLPPETLQLRMKRIYQKFLSSRPGLWVMAQFPGVTSHALLFIGMTKTPDGFHLRVIDSNRPETTRELDYHYGESSIALGKESFTPFIGFQNDQIKIDHTLNQACANQGAASEI